MDAGFLAMVAQPGMGKTTLLFHLLHKLQATTRTAFIFHTQCTSHELLRHLLSEFDCDTSITDPVRISRELKSILLAEAKAGRRCVLIIDEAQNLQPDVLETIRLLSNFETPSRKLLNIILSGQAELGEMLSRPGLQQLRQRLSCTVHLEAFAPEETALYIANRLHVAGYSGELSHIFSVHALALIAQLSNGIPRVINNICFNALSLGYALETSRIDVPVIEEVARDLGLSLQIPLAPQENAAAAAKLQETLAAISSICDRQQQEQADSDSLRGQVVAGTPEASEEHPAFPAEMEGDVAEDGASPEIRPEDAFPIVANTVAESQPNTAGCAEDQSEHQPAATLPAAPINIGNRWGTVSGLLMVRACLCAVLLCVAPALDGPSRHSVSAQKSVDFGGENLPSKAKSNHLGRNAIRHAPGSQRYLPSDVSVPSQKHFYYTSEPNSIIKQIWKASHDPEAGASLTTASSDPRQLMETRSLNSIAPASRVAPADNARVDFGAAARPGHSPPVNRGQTMSTCREEQLDGTATSVKQHDNQTQQETLCSSFSIVGADTR
jgi:general secretion pathway protein A